MNVVEGNKDHGPTSPIITTFDEIIGVGNSESIRINTKLSDFANRFGMHNMADVLKNYLSLCRAGQNKTDQALSAATGKFIVPPSVDLDVDVDNIRGKYKELTAGAVISWALFNNEAIRVPWHIENDNENTQVFSGEYSQGFFSFRRVLNREAYLDYMNTYVDALMKVEDFHTVLVQNAIDLSKKYSGLQDATTKADMVTRILAAINLQKVIDSLDPEN